MVGASGGTGIEEPHTPARRTASVKKMSEPVEGSPSSEPVGSGSELDKLLLEYKESKEKNSRYQADDETELKILKLLAATYETRFKSNGDDWTAGLRAHALWMACSLRDPENPDYIRSAFELMKSKLSLLELSTMNTENKELLERYRVNHRTLTSDVKCLLSDIDSNDWSKNVEFMTNFTSEVKRLSENITKDVIRFLGRLFDQSVKSVNTNTTSATMSSSPPCGMAVIAIGSLARGEMTTYSDIEYMFLIEDDSGSNREYFRHLAFQSYYFLSLLGESKLCTYRIDELKNAHFEDRICKAGLRIDGLGEKAGNMPTRNGNKEKHDWIFTFEELVKEYKKVLGGNSDQGSGQYAGDDLVAMITHRTLVTHFGNGKLLYEKLQDKLKRTPHSECRKIASLGLMKADLKKYPGFHKKIVIPVGLYSSGHFDIKKVIYRCISFLIIGLNNTLDLKSSSNWITIDKLVSLSQCSRESREAGAVFSFLLATAYFIRTDCYMFYSDQEDIITVFKTDDSKEPRPAYYSCPSDLFTLMTSYLHPIMRDLDNLIGKLVPEREQTDRNHSTPLLFNIGQDTFHAVCFSLSYSGRFEELIDKLLRTNNQNPKNKVCCQYLLNALLASNGLAEQHIKLVEDSSRKGWLLLDEDYLKAHCYLRTNPLKALLHAKECEMQQREQKDILVSSCYAECGDLTSWRETAKLQFSDYNFHKPHESQRFSDNVRYGPKRKRNKDLITKNRFLNQLGLLKFKQKQYEEFLHISRNWLELTGYLYGKGVLNQEVARAQKTVGIAYLKCNQLQESLKHLERSRIIEECLYGSEADHRDIAETLMNIGCLKTSMGEYEQALDFLTRSSEMMRRLYTDITPTHPDITACVGHIAKCHYDMSDYKQARERFQEILKDLSEAGTVDEDLQELRENKWINGSDVKERYQRDQAVATQYISLCYLKLEDKSAVDAVKESVKFLNSFLATNEKREEQRKRKDQESTNGSRIKGSDVKERYQRDQAVATQYINICKQKIKVQERTKKQEKENKDGFRDQKKRGK